MPAARLKVPQVNLGEETMLFQVRAMHLPPSVRNYRFHVDRKWEIDLAWPAIRLGVEIQGGIWTSGKHGRGSGIVKDMEKHNALLDAGWRVYCYTPQQVKSGEAIGHIEGILRAGFHS